MFRLTFAGERATIVGEGRTRQVRSESKSLFLALLAQRVGTGQGAVEFSELMEFPVLVNTADGIPKEEKTIKTEIGNFIRGLEGDGFEILNYTSAERGPWRINAAECELPDRTTLNPLLSRHVYTVQESAFELTETHLGLSRWIVLAANAKLAFWQGHLDVALDHLIAASRIAESPFLSAATYAEIARMVYRSETDNAQDWQTKTIDFISDTDLPPIVSTIYRPRIEASYQFQRASGLSPDERVACLEKMTRDYLLGVDVAGLCRSLNISFITYQATGGGRTQSGESKAIAATRAACVLSLSVGDPDLIQASMFNYVLALRRFRTDEDTADVEQKLLSFNYKFCKALNVGEDTAQGTLLLAEIHLSLNKHRAAKVSLSRAARIILKTKNMLDRAYFHALMGTYVQNPGGHGRALERAQYHFEKSIELYRGVGREDAVAGIERQIDRLIQAVP